jgi:hypothetical protein
VKLVEDGDGISRVAGRVGRYLGKLVQAVLRGEEALADGEERRPELFDFLHVRHGRVVRVQRVLVGFQLDLAGQDRDCSLSANPHQQGGAENSQCGILPVGSWIKERRRPRLSRRDSRTTQEAAKTTSSQTRRARRDAQYRMTDHADRRGDGLWRMLSQASSRVEDGERKSSVDWRASGCW